MDRRTTGRRYVVAERARRVRNVAVCVVVPALLLGTIMSSSDADSGVAFAVYIVAFIAMYVAALAQLVRLLAIFVASTWQPQDRELPQAAHWARLTFRTCLGEAGGVVWGATDVVLSYRRRRRHTPGPV